MVSGGMGLLRVVGNNQKWSEVVGNGQNGQKWSEVGSYRRWQLNIVAGGMG